MSNFLVKFAFTRETGVYKTLSIVRSDRHCGAYWVCDITAVSLWGRGKGISLSQVLIKL